MKIQPLQMIILSLVAAAVPVVLLKLFFGNISTLNMILGIAVPAGQASFQEFTDKKKAGVQLIAVFFASAAMCLVLRYFNV